MPTVISPSEKKRLVDGAFRVGGIGLWGMKRGRAWRPTLPAAEWGEGVSAPTVHGGRGGGILSIPAN